jgi:hypothetical protein
MWKFINKAGVIAALLHRTNKRSESVRASITSQKRCMYMQIANRDVYLTAHKNINDLIPEIKPSKGME